MNTIKGGRLHICMLATNDLLNDPRITRHAQTLGLRGFKVTVVCPQSPQTAPREIRKGYDIVRARSKVSDYLASLSWRRRQTSPKKHRSLLSRILLAVLRIFLQQIALMREARKTEAQVYCSNDLDTLLIGTLCAGFHRKLVYDSHELWVDMLIGVPAFIKCILRSVEKSLIKHADAVVTVNEFIAKELVSRYSIVSPVHVVYNYPVTKGLKRVSKRKTTGTKVALYQGRYSPERGLESLVEAALYLSRDVVLVFRGFGEIEHELRRLASGNPQVRFDDPVKMEELVESAREGDVGIVSYLPTNLCNYLASPNKLFEYIQAGLPVAASDMPFMRKIILERDIGVLFDPRNPRSIADAINRITRANVLERYRKNVASAASDYSWQKEAPKLSRIYEALKND